MKSLFTLVVAATAASVNAVAFESVASGNKDIFNMTYGELAKVRVWPEFKNLHALEATRDYFDLFAYAYPYEVMEGRDAYRLIHKRIKDIHHDAGEMKDGVRKKISQQEEVVLRDKIRDELTEFSKGMNSTRSRYELSTVFWQSIPDVLPSEQLTGLQNIAAMNQGYMRNAGDNWDAIKFWTVEELGQKFVEVHEVRKLIRAFNFTQSFFPEMWRNPEEGKIMIGEALDFYNHYTALKNPLELYTHFLSVGNVALANEEKTKMDNEWVKLKSWQESLPSERRFSQLCKTMINSMIDVPVVKEDPGMPSWAWALVFMFCVVAMAAMGIGCYKSVQDDWSRGSGYEAIQ
eukprot:CFRG4559T1